MLDDICHTDAECKLSTNNTVCVQVGNMHYFSRFKTNLNLQLFSYLPRLGAGRGPVGAGHSCYIWSVQLHFVTVRPYMHMAKN